MMVLAACVFDGEEKGRCCIFIKEIMKMWSIGVIFILTAHIRMNGSMMSWSERSYLVLIGRGWSARIWSKALYSGRSARRTCQAVQRRWSWCIRTGNIFSMLQIAGITAQSRFWKLRGGVIYPLQHSLFQPDIEGWLPNPFPPKLPVLHQFPQRAFNGADAQKQKDAYI